MTETAFWQRFIQPERRLHIRDTIEEMFIISAILYGGISLCGIIALSLPIWEEMDKFVVYCICGAGLILCSLFYLGRKHTPLWLTVLHVPVGIAMLTIVIYASHAPQSGGIAVAYMAGAMYSFHYFTRTAALSIVALAMIAFAYVMQLNQIIGWQASVFFVTGCSLIVGGIERIAVSRINFMATRDNLTGLLNRHTIDAITCELLESSRASGNRFTFLLIDLNRFKAINDSEGHLKGDEVLKTVASSLLSVTTKEDYVARWGGDEFIIILQGTDENKVKSIDMALRKELLDIISYEMGISYSNSDETIDALVRRADNSMYSKKRNRRATDASAA